MEQVSLNFHYINPPNINKVIQICSKTYYTYHRAVV